HFKETMVHLLHVLDPPLSQQAAAAQNHDVIADTLNVRQKMAGEKQAHALVVSQIAGQLQDFLAARRIHAVGRLVEDEEARVVNDGRGNLQALLHAGRVGIDLAIAGLAQADVVEHFMGPLQCIFSRHAAQLAGVRDELDADDIGKQALVLWHKAYGLANGEPLAADVHVKNLAPAGVDGNKAEERADESSL